MTLKTRAPKISAHADGGQSGGSSVRRPGSEDPHGHERIFFIIYSSLTEIHILHIFYSFSEGSYLFQIHSHLNNYPVYNKEL